MSLDTKSRNFYLFPLVALRYRHVRKSNFDAELRAIFCIPVRMKFQTTFLGRYIARLFYWHQSMQKTKMMFYTSDKLTNVFECIMFISQFHVHRKIGTLIHPITFDSISKAISCQMIAKTTRKLSRLLFFIVNEGLLKDYVNKPVACIDAIFIRFVVSYYGYRKK